VPVRAALGRKGLVAGRNGQGWDRLDLGDLVGRHRGRTDGELEQHAGCRLFRRGLVAHVGRNTGQQLAPYEVGEDRLSLQIHYGRAEPVGDRKDVPARVLVDDHAHLQADI